MSCDVCIGGGIDDPLVDYNREEVVAGEPLVCCECSRPIERGERYELATGESDDGHFVAETCLLCAEIAEVFSCGEGRVHMNLWEDMGELAFPELTTASECFTELSAAAKARVLEEWRKWKGLAHA